MPPGIVVYFILYPPKQWFTKFYFWNFSKKEKKIKWIKMGAGKFYVYAIECMDRITI